MQVGISSYPLTRPNAEFKNEKISYAFPCCSYGLKLYPALRSRFDVEHALRQHFTRAGYPRARIESRHAGEDVIAASVYLKAGKLFWSVRVDAAEARIISSFYHLGPAGFGVSENASKGHGLKREISDTQRLRRHMMGDGQPWGDWVAGIKATCAGDYRNGAPEIL